MSNSKTYELKVSFPKTGDGELVKEDFITWLTCQGIDSFVEGEVDGANIDFEYGCNNIDPYLELGGENSPILLYSYSQEEMDALKEKAGKAFQDKIELSSGAIETHVWQDGWRENFKEIHTDRFSIYPAWEKKRCTQDKIPIFIEPGMAFGTGQHASTQLCLKALEYLSSQGFDFEQSTIVDVGTGSGILAIGAAKLGAKHLFATDIDPDALKIAEENGHDNGVIFKTEVASFPKEVISGQTFDLIIANILQSVLVNLLPEFALYLAPHGKLILSGLLEEQKESFLEQARLHNLHLETSFSHEGWVGLIAIKKSVC